MGFSDALLHFIPLFGDKVDAQSKVLGFAVFDDSKEKRRFSFFVDFFFDEDNFYGCHFSRVCTVSNDTKVTKSRRVG